MQSQHARQLLTQLRAEVGGELADALISAAHSSPGAIAEQRARVAQLKQRLLERPAPTVAMLDLLALADVLVPRSLWIVGGDGWAYDIGYGGLDHVLASGKNVNILVLDTEVYSNTGGQSSKATPLGAVAKFAAAGKHTPKKDLGMLAMQYGDVYVAQVAMGASDTQTVKAFLEAEAYPGPSLIIAYSHCIAHGIDMTKGLLQQKLATECGYWPLYRYNPATPAADGKALHLDSQPPRIAFKEYAAGEGRYRVLMSSDPTAAEAFMTAAQQRVTDHWRKLEAMAA
jgi:pyruvate-ferredoxin/flavodoxin oxidoreductase